MYLGCFSYLSDRQPGSLRVVTDLRCSVAQCCTTVLAILAAKVLACGELSYIFNLKCHLQPTKKKDATNPNLLFQVHI